MLRVLAAGVAVVLTAGVVIAAYVGLSAFVLWAAGHLLPLTGRRRRP